MIQLCGLCVSLTRNGPHRPAHLEAPLHNLWKHKAIADRLHFYKKNPGHYYRYRLGCGRDQRLVELWGDEAGGKKKP